MALTHGVHALSSTLDLNGRLDAASAPGAEVVKKGKGGKGGKTGKGGGPGGKKGKGPGPGLARLRIPAAQAQSELGCAAAPLCCAIFANGRVTVTGAKSAADLGRILHWLLATLVLAPGATFAAPPSIRVNSLKTGGVLSAAPVDLRRLHGLLGGGALKPRKDGTAYRLDGVRLPGFAGLTATVWATGSYRVQGKGSEAQQRALAEELCALAARKPQPQPHETPKTPAPKRRAAALDDAHAERAAPAAPRKRARRTPAPPPLLPLDLAPAFLPIDDPMWAAGGLACAS